jgi:hypothetical protein
MSSRTTSGGQISLFLAAILLAFAAYMGVWNDDRQPGREGVCDTSSRSFSTVACAARKEDRNLMVGSGVIGLGLLGFGLLRRYPPSGSRAESA